MLIEIPEPEVILGVIIAFFIGLAGLYGYSINSDHSLNLRMR